MPPSLFWLWPISSVKGRVLILADKIVACEQALWVCENNKTGLQNKLTYSTQCHSLVLRHKNHIKKEKRSQAIIRIQLSCIIVIFVLYQSVVY